MRSDDSFCRCDICGEFRKLFKTLHNVTPPIYVCRICAFVAVEPGVLPIDPPNETELPT